MDQTLLDPESLGFHERSAGSNIWCRDGDVHHNTYEPRICLNLNCGKAFMGRRSGIGFCSKNCAGYHQIPGPVNEFGFYEKQAGSGVWSRDGDSHKYETHVCDNPACGEKFMARRDRGQFCSRACQDQAHRDPDAGYGSLHTRVERARGKASEHQCVDCPNPNPAEQWSCIHGRDGKDVWDYEPRCTKCHAEYDIELKARGEANGNAKLTEDIVRKIHASVDVSHAELARMYGVRPTTICAVRHRKTWKHIN